MSKKIGIIAEDSSDIDVLTEIIAKISPKNSFTVKKFVGNGCGKLRQKCGSWANQLLDSGCEHIILVHDLDRYNENELRKNLKEKVNFPNSLIVIPIEELEAWLLSDENAIKAVFSLTKTPKKISDCEVIKSPKEYLEKLVWSLGKKRYLNTVHNKKLSAEMNLNELLRCNSYIPLHNYLTNDVFC